MGIETGYYNYYNVQGRYSSSTTETPTWKKKYQVIDDKITSCNHSQDSDAYKAYTKLEETYYSLSVSNRSRYSTKSELISALQQKYYQNGAYSQYDYCEKKAMFENELNMTLYGCLDGGGNVDDPHLTGKVMLPSDGEKQEYNRHMVNIQLGNILSKGGIDMGILHKNNITFSIDPFHYMLQVSGVDNLSLVQKMEELLNKEENSKELFYHILKSNSNSISNEVLVKYRALKDFQNITGQDLRDYKQVNNTLINNNGENALDVYKNALKTSDAVPTQYKGDAFNYFASKIENLISSNFANIPDLNLTIGYANGSLYDMANQNIMVSKFNATI